MGVIFVLVMVGTVLAMSGKALNCSRKYLKGIDCDDSEDVMEKLL